MSVSGFCLVELQEDEGVIRSQPFYLVHLKDSQKRRLCSVA
jgi:hypothetical protein